MSDWQIVFSDPEPWPLVHVFVPAIVSIYCKNIWILISIIYLFESLEFLVSQLPLSGADYWGEISPIDAMVSDIVMGLIGYAAVVATNSFKQGPKPKYACLKPDKNSTNAWRTVAPYIHVLLSSGASSIVALSHLDGVFISIEWQFISFGIFYVLLALAFGHTKWAIFSVLNISLITLASLLTQHTALYSAGIVLFTSAGSIVYRNYLNPKQLSNTVPETNPLIKRDIIEF